MLPFWENQSSGGGGGGLFYYFAGNEKVKNNPVQCVPRCSTQVLLKRPVWFNKDGCTNLKPKKPKTWKDSECNQKPSPCTLLYLTLSELTRTIFVIEVILRFSQIQICGLVEHVSQNV